MQKEVIIGIVITIVLLLLVIIWAIFGRKEKFITPDQEYQKELVNTLLKYLKYEQMSPQYRASHQDPANQAYQNAIKMYNLSIDPRNIHQSFGHPATYLRAAKYWLTKSRMNPTQLNDAFATIYKIDKDANYKPSTYRNEILYQFLSSDPYFELF